MDSIEINYHRIKNLHHINLPNSKSIENRLLMLHFLSGRPIPPTEDNDCNDVIIFKRNLSLIAQRSTPELITIDVEDCGLAWRFLTVLLAITPHHWRLTGTPRLKSRPILPLVQTLQNAGADIQIDTNNDLLIRGTTLKSDSLSCDVSQTGQYLSALLLIQPFSNLKNITTSEKITSEAYIHLTRKLISDYQKNPNLSIEKDWSSAAYWYAAALLNPESQFCFENLPYPSWQPDSVITDIGSAFGLKTICQNNQTILQNTNAKKMDYFQYDFSSCIDIAPCFITCLALLNKSAKFTGLAALKYKESDRFQALFENLSMFAVIEKQNNDTLILKKSEAPNYRQILHFKTFQDHRLAMSFALAAYRFSNITIDHTECVHKSYPQFWAAYQKCQL